MSNGAARLLSHPRSGTALVLLTILVTGWPVILPAEALPTRLSDDAFYYYTIARNISEGSGPTFDGLHLTNGFHPLWLGIGVVVFSLVPGVSAPLRALIGLQAILCGLVCWFLIRRFSSRGASETGLLCALTFFALPRALPSLTGGLDAALAAFLLLAALDLRSDQPRARSIAWTLACLARLEMCIAVAFDTALRLVRTEPGKRPWRSVAVSLPPAAVIVAYSTWNLHRFGYALPVSARTKSWLGSQTDGATPWLDRMVDVPWVGHLLVGPGSQSVRSLSPTGYAAYLLLVISVVGLLYVRRSDLRSRAVEFDTGRLVAACLAISLVGFLGQGRYYHAYPWQHGPLLLAQAVVFAMLVHRHERLRRVAITVALLANVAGSYRQVRAPSHGSVGDAANLGREMASILPPSARVGSWNSGAIGYYSRRHVVNLDGLVNSHEYFERVIRDGDLRGYLADEGIGFLANHAPSAQELPRRMGRWASQLEGCTFDKLHAVTHPEHRWVIGLWAVRCGALPAVGP